MKDNSFKIAVAALFLVVLWIGIWVIGLQFNSRLGILENRMTALESQVESLRDTVNHNAGVLENVADEIDSLRILSDSRYNVVLAQSDLIASQYEVVLANSDFLTENRALIEDNEGDITVTAETLLELLNLLALLGY